MDVISPDDDSLVKGSHGRVTDDPLEGPVFIAGDSSVTESGQMRATDVAELILNHALS